MSSSQSPAHNDTSGSDEMDYQEVDEDGVLYIDQATLETLMAQDDEDDENDEDFNGDEDEDEDEGDNMDDRQMEAEIEGNIARNAARSERFLYIFSFLKAVMLILLGIIQRQLLRYIQNGRIYHIARELDDDEDIYGSGWRRRRRQRPDPNRFPKVPSDEGTELMGSGKFGCDEADAVTSSEKALAGKKKLAMRILDRELATESPVKQRLNQKLMAQGMIPSSNADTIIHYNQPVYSGQFSDDGNFFFSANKDFRVRMYDTSNPYNWRYYKTVEYPFGRWTLTDASLSPDNKYLAYTSIQSTVCLAPTDPNDMGDPYVLDLASSAGNPANTRFHSRFGSAFGIWSIRYSGDGRELVAGCTSGSIVVYDIESRTPLHRIYGHDEDVNAVCFADTSSPHILYSGSDDTTMKVWDTRSMGDSRAAGVFVGHIEGITYIDSKGDGRYVLSNGKDQSMKLWDLRMVMANSEFENYKPHRLATQHRFDYRFGPYDEDDWYKDPKDNSLVTYRGHKVLRTLIRCHFSPPGSTNSRYVYSGSEDGKVYIWNMDATLAGVIDVYKATLNSRPRPSGRSASMWSDYDEDGPWRTCVRDASWHPNAPMIVASAWNGYGTSTGTCTLHSWNDGAEEDEAEPKMGERVDQKLVRGEEFYFEDPPESRRTTRRTAALRAMFPDSDD